MLKVPLMLTPPLLVLVLCIYSIPGVPFTCSSIGVATVCSTVCASAPVYDPLTETLGGEILGYWSTARLKRQIKPEIQSTTDITIAVTGLLINVFAIISIKLCPVHVIFPARTPVPGRYSAPQSSFLFPSAVCDAFSGIPAWPYHKTPV